MGGDSTHSISTAIAELCYLNTNDILADTSVNRVIRLESTVSLPDFQLSADASLQTILKSAENFRKETGTGTLCLAHGLIEWEIRARKVLTPILLIPLDFKRNKVLNQVSFSGSADDFFINPFLIHYLTREFQIHLSEHETGTGHPQQIAEKMASLGFHCTYHDDRLLGNFHHHRYQIVKDLEELQSLERIGPHVLRMLGEEDSEPIQTFRLTDANLFPADNDQLQVFEQLNDGKNIVIQGPPGTGKSQVLSNLTGKILAEHLSALIVSEKRVALEVLEKKLSRFRLDDFTFISTSETVTGEFISSLKKTWDRLENGTRKEPVFLQLSKQYLAQLQQLLDLLSNPELIGGISYDEFHTLAEKYPYAPAVFTTDVPPVRDVLEHEHSIRKLYEHDLISCLNLLRPEVFKNSLLFHPHHAGLDIKINEWRQLLEKTILLFPEKNTPALLDELIKQAAICQILENEADKAYAPLFNPDSKERKRYYQLRKKYYAFLNEWKPLQNEQQNWKTEPSENEVSGLLNTLQHGSYFKKRKARKRIAELTTSGFVQPVEALGNWLKFLEKRKEYTVLIHAFHEMGVYDPDTELPAIDTFLNRIDANDWNIYRSLEPETRKKVCELHSDLHQLHTVLKSYFRINPEMSVATAFDILSKGYENLTRYHSMIAALPLSVYRLVTQSASFELFLGSVLKGNLLLLENRFPQLSRFRPEDFSEKMAVILQHQDEESNEFAQLIEARLLSRFKAYHQLLRTPAHKLSVEEKELKQRLRKGKSILVKEFGKTRQHPSVRELLETDASLWIRLLKPVWLCNPAQTARCFPLEEGLFDFVIFDEASQIPLSHAFGSLHRGKQIIIAGDEQQMSPSSYFRSGTTEVTDLLHQAGYYWKNVCLKHHYRSTHPELIAFSNRHFYQDSLIAYPSGDHSRQPIRFYYCETGLFEDRKNKAEAAFTARLIEENIARHRTIGIVAFSGTQLQCIREHLSDQTAELLAEKTDAGEAFFKALEDVQGEECDHLIISLGYGKTENGDFPMRFGPLNQKNGAKRLNVLLTRARHSMDFVASVRSSDFKLSDNESVNLLRLFMQRIEQQTENEKEDSLLFPYHLDFDVSNTGKIREVRFPGIYRKIHDANELVTLHRVLTERNWNVSY